MRNIRAVKNVVVKVRHSLRAFIWASIAVLLIIAILGAFYKPAYIVTYNGEFLGYCSSKSKMQEKINRYIATGNSTDPNIAYVDMDAMPEYSITFLKRNIDTSDEQIYDTITQIVYTENGVEKPFTEEDLPQINSLFERLLSTENERIQATVFDKVNEIEDKINDIKENQQKEGKRV